MAIETAVDPQAPFFATDSAIRRIHREGILILSGGRSLLMQIAHPSVAQGVAEHSSYKTARTARLMRTLRSTLAVVFGTREQAEAAIAGINRLHQRVNGETYSALDPELLLWVLATLVDTTVETHERFVEPIAPEDAAAYYADVCLIGGLLGIPDGHMPEDLAAMRAYVARMSAKLEVSATAREIAHDLFAPLPRTGPAMWVYRQVTSGLLHPALRDGFGLSWGPRRDLLLRTVQWCCRNLLRRLPLRMRGTPRFLLPPRS